MDKEKALQTALRYLKNARSGYEVKQNLRSKGCTVSVADEVIEELKGLGYLDDKRLVEDWLTFRAEDKLYGRFRLYRELRKKGLSDSLIRDGLAEFYSYEREWEMAKRLLKLRFGKVRGFGKGDKAVETLIRYGFSPETIEKCTGVYVDETEEAPEDGD